MSSLCCSFFLCISCICMLLPGCSSTCNSGKHRAHGARQPQQMSGLVSVSWKDTVGLAILALPFHRCFDELSPSDAKWTCSPLAVPAGHEDIEIKCPRRWQRGKRRSGKRGGNRERGRVLKIALTLNLAAMAATSCSKSVVCVMYPLALRLGKGTAAASGKGKEGKSSSTAIPCARACLGAGTRESNGLMISLTMTVASRLKATEMHLPLAFFVGRSRMHTAYRHHHSQHFGTMFGRAFAVLARSRSS